MDRTNQINQAYPAGEVNLIDYWRVIWKGKIFIILIVIICSFATTFVSLRMPNIYQAKAVITPVQARTAPGLPSLAQQLGGIAGISLPSPPLSSEIVSLLKSNILREKIIYKYNLLPVLFSEQWDEEKKAWKKEKKSILNPSSVVLYFPASFTSPVRVTKFSLRHSAIRFT